VIYAACATPSTLTSAQDAERAARDVITSGSLKGELVSRVEKEVWRGKAEDQSATIFHIGDFELLLGDLGDRAGILAVTQVGKILIAQQTEGSAPTLLYDLALGLDADNDGVPDTAVVNYSGGAHCCFTYQVLNFGSKFRIGATIDGGNGGVALESAGPPVVFRMSEEALQYWHCSFVESVFPSLLFTIEDDKPILADAWMRRDAPTDLERAALFAAIQDAYRNPEVWLHDPDDNLKPFLPRILIEKVTDLIYNGNGEIGIQLFLDAWQGDAARRDAIGAELLSQLSKSVFWDQVRQMNGWTGDPAAIWAGAVQRRSKHD
jgi:hypothetical protein